MRGARRHALALVAVLGGWLAGGCGDSSGPGGGELTVSSVIVTPAGASVEVGSTQQYAALAVTASDQPVPGTTFTWGTSDSGIATISGGGLLTAVSAGPVTVSATGGGKTGTTTATITLTPPPPAVLLAAGDIAVCDSSHDEATALLLDTRAGSIAALGDNAYQSGTLTEYTTCYGPSWGRHKARTRPAPGNHEYLTAGAPGYWDYWGALAGPRDQGWYSYDLGSWHIIVLNSNCTEVGCTAGSAQEQWLRADLAAHPAQCTLAYWHHPRFSSGASHGNNTAVGPFWQALYDAGAEIVLNGHEHLYERFAPQTPGAAADAAGGIRQFTVGTGGRTLVAVGTLQPNSQVLDNGTYGILQLTLGQGSYAWAFVPVAGSSFTDQGTGTCH